MVRAVRTMGREIGAGQSVFIIAEAGVNHNGDLDLAKRLVDAAAAAGADAVKFQTFQAEKVVSAVAPKAEYQRHTTDPDESQLEMVRRLELSADAFRELQAYCSRQHILFLSTPFDEQSADLLDAMGMPIFKIGSGEITNFPFLTHIARKRKPIILSTGMSYLGEVDDAVRVLRGAGCKELILLHCVSNYPAKPTEVNLRAMQTMATAFGVPVGYSDHAPGIEVSLAAAALGACVVEKHFTLDRDMPGPDHRASLEPEELCALVKGIRVVESALGSGLKQPAASELEIMRAARRSLVAARDIDAGAVLTPDLIAILRPGTGLAPALRSSVVGRRARTRIPQGTCISLEMLE